MECGNVESYSTSPHFVEMKSISEQFSPFGLTQVYRRFEGFSSKELPLKRRRTGTKLITRSPLAFGNQILPDPSLAATEVGAYALTTDIDTWSWI